MQPAVNLGSRGPPRRLAKLALLRPSSGNSGADAGQAPEKPQDARRLTRPASGRPCSRGRPRTSIDTIFPRRLPGRSRTLQSVCSGALKAMFRRARPIALLKSQRQWKRAPGTPWRTVGGAAQTIGKRKENRTSTRQICPLGRPLRTGCTRAHHRPPHPNAKQLPTGMQPGA